MTVKLIGLINFKVKYLEYVYGSVSIRNNCAKKTYLDCIWHHLLRLNGCEGKEEAS